MKENNSRPANGSPRLYDVRRALGLSGDFFFFFFLVPTERAQSKLWNMQNYSISSVGTRSSMCNKNKNKIKPIHSFHLRVV